MPKSGKKIPVLLFAHLDTKQKEDEAPKHILFDPDYRVMWTPETLGADDRAGVYAVLKLIEQRNCSVLFTTGEERVVLGQKNSSSIIVVTSGTSGLVFNWIAGEKRMLYSTRIELKTFRNGSLGLASQKQLEASQTSAWLALLGR